MGALTEVASRVKPDGSMWVDHRKEHSVLRLGELGGCDVVIVRSGPGPMSPIGLMATVEAVVRDMRPDFMVLTGICYGLHDPVQSLGDIVIASQVRDTDHRKLIEDASVVTELSRGERRGPDHKLFRSMVAAATGRTHPAVHVGPMVASGTLLNSPTRRAELISANPDAIAGDMESHVFSAVGLLRKTDWCVVRGISDWGKHKSDGHQRLAAENAAAFVLEVISSGALAQTASRVG
jgi:nucleoside phosphorylase